MRERSLTNRIRTDPTRLERIDSSLPARRIAFLRVETLPLALLERLAALCYGITCGVAAIHNSEDKFDSPHEQLVERQDGQQ